MIRDRSGVVREVDDDNYVLKDGEGLVVPLSLMDAMRTPMIHDGTRPIPQGATRLSDQRRRTRRAGRRRCVCRIRPSTLPNGGVADRGNSQTRTCTAGGSGPSPTRKTRLLTHMRPTTTTFRSAGIGARGQPASQAESKPQAFGAEPQRTFDSPEAAAMPPMRNMTRFSPTAGDANGDHAALPPVLVKIEEPSVNTVAIAQIDLDARIAAAFSDRITSSEIADLIEETQAASLSADTSAEGARARALDPILSTQEVDAARRAMEDARFRRERLANAVIKLEERLAQVLAEEEDHRRRIAYDKAQVERDKLAAELTDIYPAFAQRLAELLPRIAANDREVDYINGHALPSGAKRLLVAELKARGLPWVVDSVEPPRITNQLYLPSWEPRSTYLWPPRT